MLVHTVRARGCPLVIIWTRSARGCSHIQTFHIFTQIPLTWDACGLHARGGVHRVAKDAELGQLGADQAAEVGTGGAGELHTLFGQCIPILL